MTPQLMLKKGLGFCGHADIAVPKCAGADYYTKPQCQEGLTSSSGPVDGHVDTYVTPSTEFIVCVYFKNLYIKIVYEVEMKRLFPNEKAPWETCCRVLSFLDCELCRLRCLYS
jgi:hypothetical protein